MAKRCRLAPVAKHKKKGYKIVHAYDKEVKKVVYSVYIDAFLKMK